MHLQELVPGGPGGYKIGMTDVITTLLESDEPSVRFHVRANVLGEDGESAAVRRLREEVRASPRVAALLSERTADGGIPHHPYAKWDGAHWVLAVLADLGYPPGDASLIPLREQVCEWLLSKDHIRGIRTIRGRTRRCASQEGNALHAMLKLGLDDERCDVLAARLMRWQWPDGGWNCDVKPAAVNSSFHESLIPMRALAAYGRTRRSEQAIAVACGAAEIFLKRRLFRRERDGAVMNERFLRLCYPPYWCYNVLFALKVLAEMDLLVDPRCAEALELLESKRLPDGGFPAEGKHYRVSRDGSPAGRRISGRSLVRWGPVGRRRMNEFVTADALGVLAAAGRRSGAQPPRPG
jgi:hypothetical protein